MKYFLIAAFALCATLAHAQSVITSETGTIKNGFQYAVAAPVTTAASTVFAPAVSANAGFIRAYLTGLEYQNTSATPTEVQVLDGTTVIFRSYAGASMAAPAVIHFPTPLIGTANTAMSFKVFTTGANVYFDAQGYLAR